MLPMPMECRAEICCLENSILPLSNPVDRIAYRELMISGSLGTGNTHCWFRQRSMGFIICVAQSLPSDVTDHRVVADAQIAVTAVSMLLTAPNCIQIAAAPSTATSRITRCFLFRPARTYLTRCRNCP